jgi:hypothetical protein
MMIVKRLRGLSRRELFRNGGLLGLGGLAPWKRLPAAARQGALHESGGGLDRGKPLLF